jgi:glycosyltransferase involved in cell wall biosynthesis
MMDKERTLIILPAYNEARNIAGVISGILEALPEVDILVIDDGSADKTGEQARKAGAKVLSHPFNMGYGVAIQTGYKYADRAGYEYLVQLDADGQHDPTGILTLLQPVINGEADFALGSRFLASSESYRPSLPRRIGMKFFRFLVTRIIRQDLKDCTSGFQAFNARVIHFFTRDIFPCDYPDADVLISLHLAGFRMKEVPVTMYENAAGKSMHSGAKPLYYVFKMLLSILVTVLRSRKFYQGS